MADEGPIHHHGKVNGEPGTAAQAGKAIRVCAILKSVPFQAGMAELADAADSKSADPCGRGGSTPPPGTKTIFRMSCLEDHEFVRAKFFPA
jgi:hypothetical protein